MISLGDIHTNRSNGLCISLKITTLPVAFANNYSETNLNYI
jgi:hypothetical protein